MRPCFSGDQSAIGLGIVLQFLLSSRNQAGSTKNATVFLVMVRAAKISADIFS